MKSFSKAEIENLITSPEDFKQAIIDSKGFVLYMADKNTITLSPELLIETISPYSIRFMSEHMKSHKYTQEQTEIVVRFLTEDNDNDNNEIITKYTLDNLLHDIKEDNNIPRNAKELLKLTFNDFLAHPKEFVQLIYKSSDEFWGADAFFSNHYLLDPIFKKLTKEEFLQIDKTTLATCPALFNMAKHLMLDKDIKNLFHESAQAYFQSPERVKSGYKNRLENYKHYEFEPHEKELFITLLKNNYSSDYDKTKNYKGFEHFFTKEDYIFNYNISGIQYLSPREIADNLPVIRTGILNAYFKSHYSNIEKIYQLNINEDSFKDIFTTDFVKEIIQHNQGFYFHHFEREQKKKTDFMNIFHQKVLTLCGENTNILNIVGITTAMKNITSILEHDRSYFNETYANAAQNIIKNFNTSLTTKNLFVNFNDGDAACFGQYDIPKLLVESMTGKESVNYLYALMSIHNHLDRNAYKQKPFVEEIDRVIPLINADDVKTLGKMLGYKVKSKLLNKDMQSDEDFTNNFLQFTPSIIENMNFGLFKSIFMISKEFRTAVLQNNLDNIIVEQKLQNPEDGYSDLMSQLLRSTSNNKSPYFAFLKSFIKKNKDFMLEHYMNSLISHPLREDLIKINTQQIENDSYDKLQKLIGEFNSLSLQYNELYANRDEKNKKERKKIDSLRDEVNKKKENLQKEITPLVSNLSFDFYLDKIQTSDVITAIQLYKVANTNQEKYREAVLDKIENLNFKTLQELSSQKEFLHFIFDNGHNQSYNKQNRVVVFNSDFTKEQNIEIVEDLLKNFNNPDIFIAQYHKNISLSKILYFIPAKNRYEISNDLAIKHDPVQLFHSYDYVPNDSSYFDRHVNQHYSYEQVIKAIDTLNEKGLKIICVNDQNLPHSHLLSYNYSYKDKVIKTINGKQVEREEEVIGEHNKFFNDYKKLLKHLENDPINYLACVHSDIIANFIEKDKYDNTDLAKSAFYEKHINVDIINQAYKDIFSSHNDMMTNKEWHENVYQGVALKNAIRAIGSFNAFSYSHYGDKYSSELSEEKSRLLLDTIIKQAPYLFFSTSTLGKINTDNEISMNFSDYFHNDMIEDFFIGNTKQQITYDHFSVNYEKKNQEWQSVSADNFINSLIKHLIQNSDADNIYKLDFLIQEKKFNKQRPYGKKLEDFSSTLLSFVAQHEYENLLEKSLGYLKMIKMTERLNNTPRVKVKPTKI